MCKEKMGNWGRVAAIALAGMTVIVISHDSNYTGVLRTKTKNTINTSASAVSIDAAGVGKKAKGRKSWHYRYEHVDRKKLEASCASAKECVSSKQYWIVCGSDGVNYQNLGMLACAQRCKIDLKFKGFGACENSVPLPFPTFPPVESSSSKPVSRSRKLTEFAKEAQLSLDEEKVLQVLKNRIKSRHKHYGGPQEVELWCRDHPTECPYGFDPSINRGVYIIPAVPYDDKDFEPHPRSFSLSSM